MSHLQFFFIMIGMVIFLTIPKTGRREFAELGIILFLSLVTEFTGLLNLHFFHTNVNLVFNSFNLLNLPFAVLLYRHRIHWARRDLFSYSLITLFVLFSLINLFFIQGPFTFNSYTTSLASVCFIILSLIYFFVLIQQLPTESITKLPMFWINTAMLLYYSGTFFLYLSRAYLVNVLKDNQIVSWLIHNLLGLMLYGILSYGMLLVRA